jgi:Fur family transcriptional regulator, peroxide stress response regulator
MESIKQLLESKGLQPSFQRIRIMKYLAESKEHPTVLMVFEALNKEIPTLSKTTVYNTLRAFVQKGLVCELPLTTDEKRYDHTIENHHHFLCRHCGRVFDVYVSCQYGQAPEIEGHKVEEMHGHFRGVCRECLTGPDRDE